MIEDTAGLATVRTAVFAREETAQHPSAWNPLNMEYDAGRHVPFDENVPLGKMLRLVRIQMRAAGKRRYSKRLERKAFLGVEALRESLERRLRNSWGNGKLLGDLNHMDNLTPTKYPN